MSKNIQISTNNKDDIVIISITGDVTATSQKAIWGAYQNDTVVNSSKILLRFAKNCYINSGGLAAVIDIAVEGRKKGQKINACGLSNHFQKIFHMVGLTRCILVFPSEEAAIIDLSKTYSEGALQ